MEGSGENMKLDFMDRLQKARTISNVVYSINSGWRTPYHNKLVGGDDESGHMVGDTCDIKTKGSKHRYSVLNGLLKAGFTRIGIYPRHIHIRYNKNHKSNKVYLSGY